ncbi:ribonuclease P protein component [Gilvimarinus algae]|uniref:Ribonuclease P protein component n=1 Tax=Gilvimarinus algae TaxID=3058037 RepID=A0ABT8TDH1_9GAMM|nr:ribonuclease P protein component [Gilvimarinus sp. SDUM040014]MDO3381670.1 ribonuclease P protein component [Gilvimarinus sp. SDUM040014]
MSSLSFRRHQRLLNAADFQAVFAEAPLRASHQHLLILSRPNDLHVARLGLVIAKKNIKLAVQRNRIKRLVRESFRANQHQLTGLDVIVLARRGLDELDNSAITKTLEKQWQRLIRKKAQALGGAPQ